MDSILSEINSSLAKLLQKQFYTKLINKNRDYREY